MKLWGGRFEKETAREMDDFHSSIHFDYRLYKYDILGSIAHAKMLGKQNIISPEEAETICRALSEILEEIENGTVKFSIEAEDIHMNVESFLIKKIGDLGKKLHTGRSRNDQVALATRMYTKDAIKSIQSQLIELCETLLHHSKQHMRTIMPGYTHLQKAQPITLAHHFMAYFEMFRRDYHRMEDCFKRTDVMPLGSGALAATTYPLDREYVAELLGFSSISRNSMDAVSDRDFVIEFLFCASMVMMHLSRFCEEIILWASSEFDFIEIDDAYSTGSSIMPQKKNPDAAELVRGKTGRVYGDLMAVLTVMKSLPLAYNKDMQEDKEALFDGIDTLQKCVKVFNNMLKTLTFKTENMYSRALEGFTNATDAADYLVKKGLPFRDAHKVIGRLVMYCIKEKKSLLDLSLQELQGFSPLFERDVFDALSLETCVNQRNLPGGPAAVSVSSALNEAQAWIEWTKKKETK